jgi:hypothetical protein
MRGSCHYQFSVLTDYATEFCTRIQSRVHSYHVHRGTVPLIDGLKLFIRCRATKGVGAKLHRAFSTTIKKGFQ